MRAELTGLGAARSLDIAVRCSLHRLEQAKRAGAAAALAASGVTWLLEGFGSVQDAAEVTAYVRAGPPAGGAGPAH